MKSKITGGGTQPLFSATILGKHEISYYRCLETGFIQTETPFWLEEAYTEAITKLDIGLLSRNVAKTEFSTRTLPLISPQGQRFLDYGGGYGIFTRLMRDAGFDFHLYDPHCKCLFAEDFKRDSLQPADIERYDCITAWEVFEHLEDPKATLEELMQYTECLLFSTLLVPEPVPQVVDDWWYFTPETGQHIAFYTIDALEHLANQLGLHFISDGEAHHAFCHSPIASDLLMPSRWMRMKARWRRRVRSLVGGPENPRPSLTPRDYEAIQMRLRDDTRTSKNSNGQ